MIASLRLAGVELEPWEQEYLTRLLGPGQYTRNTVDQVGDLGDPEVLFIFIHSRVTADIVQRFPKLKLLCTLSTGYDHIDLAACRAKGITVCNVPTYGEATVAEHTFALLLALTHHIVPSVTQARNGDWRLDNLRGHNLAGKILGVIGTGRIGQHVIRMAQGFGMDVVAYDPFPNHAWADQLGFSYLSLPELLRKSDVVSLHCPATPATHHLLNEERLMMMKSTAYLINTARGSLVDTQALLRVLGRGHLSGVGLDVLEEETAIKEERQLVLKNFPPAVSAAPIVIDQALLSNPRVIITPHNAFNTVEALERILATTVENVKTFQQGQPVNVVQ